MFSLRSEFVASTHEQAPKHLSINYSNSLSASRPFFTSSNFESNQMDVYAHLFDTLTKRHYLLRLLQSNLLGISSDNVYNPTMDNPIVQLIKQSNQPVSLPRTTLSKYDSKNGSTLRSQYQPLRKGITNMIRIQADKAVAMPTDTRLQILAVSKDIIHSWSIPSAGIKIDCIPGYSSHRVAMFTLSGIY